MSNVTTLSALREPQPHQQMMTAPVTAGFFDLQSFELMQRVSKMFASSNIVPEAYRSVIEKLDRYGNVKESRENPRALANCAVALSMAQRMNADPMMVMQNLHIIEGRPSWSSQWIIAAVNSCGRFSPLHFDIQDKGPGEVEFTETYWEGKERRTRTKKITVHNKICTAWATEKATGDRIESPPVSIEIAVKEGWYGRNGSKWQTMPDMMLRYRSAAFFGKLYAPEILMGLSTAEEAHDIIDVTRQDDGGYAVTVETLRDPASPAPAIDHQAAADQHQTTDDAADAPEWPKANPETGELVNAHGVPWDERFHSSSKACNDNGTWRRKRGCDPALADRYEREAMERLRGTASSGPEPQGEQPADTTAPDPNETDDDYRRLRDGIASANNQSEIDDWWVFAREIVLTPSQRAELSKLVTERKAQWGKEAGTPEPESDFEKIRAGLLGAANEDEILDWWSESQGVVISSSQRLALESARDERRRQLSAQAG